jgi:ComF family protein
LLNCSRCGRFFDAKFNIDFFECAECKERNFYFDAVRSLTPYQGVIRDCIMQLKYKKKTGLVKILGRALVDFLKELPYDIKGYDFLVPVPLHKRRLRERGFNQAELLAKEIGRYFKIPVLSNNLKRIINTDFQSKLARKERLKNVKDAFVVKDPICFEDKRIILIDDVFTTGSTVNECSKALKEARTKEILVITLASG